MTHGGGSITSLTRPGGSIPVRSHRFYPYNAFVDESIQDQRYGIKANGVAAYVATFDNWLHLEKEWRQILANWSVKYIYAQI